jgi:5'-methylthioadenosine phosphorylase
MFAVIGGSGFEKFDGFEVVELLDRNTPFGLAASGLKRVRVEGKEFLFLSRHGEHHEHLPSEVNYRANIFALKKHGARAVVSFSAVGSLEKDCAPGDLVVPDQYIDRTKGFRQHTFLGEGVIGHCSLAHPTCDVMEGHLRAIAKTGLGFAVHFGKTYICIEGPSFSTQAESMSYRQMGANIIGMSNFPEYALAREAGLPYLPCCFVTDYDCWDDTIPHVTVDEVIKVMKANNQKAFTLFKEILKSNDFYLNSKAPAGGLRSGLFMPKDAIPVDKREWVELLMQ